MPWDQFHGSDYGAGRGFSPMSIAARMAATPNATRPTPSSPPPPAWGAPTVPTPSASSGAVVDSDPPSEPAEPTMTPQQARADARARRRSEEHVERVTSTRRSRARLEQATGSLGLKGWATAALSTGAGGFDRNWLSMEPSRVTEGIGPLGQSSIADYVANRTARAAQAGAEQEAADTRLGARIASEYPDEQGDDDVSGIVSPLRPSRPLSASSPFPRGNWLPKGSQLSGFGRVPSYPN